MSVQTQTPPVVARFARMALELKPVERIVWQWDGDELKVWCIVNNANQAQRNAIYDLEWDVTQVFKDIDVEFNLIDRRERPLEEVVKARRLDMSVST